MLKKIRKRKAHRFFDTLRSCRSRGDRLEAKTTLMVTLSLNHFQNHCWEQRNKMSSASDKKVLGFVLFCFFPLNFFFSEVTKKSFVSGHEFRICIHFGL